MLFYMLVSANWVVFSHWDDDCNDEMCTTYSNLVVCMLCTAMNA